MDSLDHALNRLVAGSIASINVASGIRLAMRIASESYDVCAVVDALRSDRNAPERVIARLVALAADSGDKHYTHQHDAPMFGMLYALHVTHPMLALATAQGELPDGVISASWTVGLARWLSSTKATLKSTASS